jgi:hypothetical protein
VPTDAGASPPDSLARAVSLIDRGAGCDAKVALIASNPLMSAAPTTVNASASLLMYCVRFPGFGWLLIHCGVPPLPFDSAAIVSNMRPSARGSYPARAIICAPSKSACFSKSRL